MKKIEPYGYFRAEPFGWTDCKEGDDGAVALYEEHHIVELTEMVSVLESKCEAMQAELLTKRPELFLDDASGDALVSAQNG